YSPLRETYPQGGIEMSIADLLKYTLQQSDNMPAILLLIIKVVRMPIVRFEKHTHREESK
ncbi:hypothetical protein E7X23_26490, partial [Bacteroides fragilis]